MKKTTILGLGLAALLAVGCTVEQRDPPCDGRCTCSDGGSSGAGGGGGGEAGSAGEGGAGGAGDWCEDTAACHAIGQCTYDPEFGGCVVGDDADCQQSEICETQGWCHRCDQLHCSDVCVI